MKVVFEGSTSFAEPSRFSSLTIPDTWEANFDVTACEGTLSDEEARKYYKNKVFKRGACITVKLVDDSSLADSLVLLIKIFSQQTPC